MPWPSRAEPSEPSTAVCSAATAGRKTPSTPCGARSGSSDQIGRRYGLPLPIEVAYDEYTEDIEHNRLLKTAIHRLSHAHIRSMAVRQELRRLRSAFDMVHLGYVPARSRARDPVHPPG